MSILQAIILGVVQGLTEFLPVSSSGHIELAQALLGMDSLKENEAALSVALHAATALSTMVVFRKEITEIIKGLLAFRLNEATRFSGLILLSMLPAVFVGLVFEEQLEALFESNILLVGLMLLLTGCLLYFAHRAGHPNGRVKVPQAIGIGIAQMIAILPGISRSGSTISAALLMGVDRQRAARFSFLMVLPLIFGKMLLDVKEAAETDFTAWQGLEIPLLVGFVAAFLTGLFACRLMLRIVQRSQLNYFAWYCFLVGALALGWVLI